MEIGCEDHGQWQFSYLRESYNDSHSGQGQIFPNEAAIHPLILIAPIGALAFLAAKLFREK
jgi:hypothetical protein